MGEKKRYTEGICQDGAAIMKDGEMITIDQVLSELNEASIDAYRLNWLGDNIREQGELRISHDGVDDQTFREGIDKLIEDRKNG